MTEEKYKKFTLQEDGFPDVTFTGREIASASSHVRNGVEQNTYSDVSVYETRGGKYVVQVIHVSQWQGEGDTSEVHEYDSLADLAADMQDEEVIPLAIELGRELSKEYPAFRSVWVRKIE